MSTLGNYQDMPASNYLEVLREQTGVSSIEVRNENGTVVGYDLPGVGVVQGNPRGYNRLNRGMVMQMIYTNPTNGRAEKAIFYPGGDLEIVVMAEHHLEGETVREKSPLNTGK